uniref:Transcription factor Adf-1 n=2 Tax=Ceratitis capitata TaxID=7213 RepID=W8CDM1_CERCA
MDALFDGIDWMITDEERLVELVKKHEIIYNNRCVGFKGADKRSIWAQIGVQIGMTGEECFKKWTSIRERYTRELKNFANKPNHKTEWLLFYSLSFLREYVKQRPGRSHATEVDNGQLIELVRRHEILYNKQGFGSQCSDQKEKAWNEIAEELCVTAEECYNRWKSLRERYTRELRQQIYEGKTDKEMDWPLFTSFSFLKNYVKQRPYRKRKCKRVCKYSVDASEASNSPALICKKELYTEATPVRSEGDPLSSADESSADNREELTTGEYLNYDEQSLHEAAETCEKSSIGGQENNAIYYFGQTIVAILSEMSEVKQAKAMRLMFDALITIKTEPE